MWIKGGIAISRQFTRATKGLIVASAAAWVSSLIVAHGFAVEQENTEQGGLGIDFTVGLFSFLSAAVIALVAWAGMRILGEKRNALLIGSVVVFWLFVSLSLEHPMSEGAQWLTVCAYGVGGAMVSWMTVDESAAP
ncbi:hypothetical protein RM572_12475 [Streptomyces sp. DSM 42041]|uniref:Uncharacterized protein n=1 Tax=Streptomyces hazeniae TaxID=3075538 RepID=A0ABU2NSJ7_9ACTN|nr:hypothetical protein [Streptomyces sp. DSM 42041]MDT0379581.1 hypothetical protein [Streptomyces sp. DSM 42041]